MSEREHPRFESCDAPDDEPFVFFLAADPQLGMMNGAHSWETDITAFNNMLDILNAITPKPRFCAVLGDLVHHCPEIYSTAVDDCAGVYSRQVSSFKQCLSRVSEDIPILLLPGNHDVGNAPTEESIARFTNEFGLDYYQFSIGNLHVIALNSGLLYDPSIAPKEALAQDAWLDRTLSFRASKDADGSLQTRIVLLHHPVWLEACDEPDQLESRSHTRGRVISNSCFHLSRARRQPFLDKLLKAGNVACIFSGHFHQNRASSSSERGRTNGNVIRMVTTASACECMAPVVDGACMPNVDKPGFRIVKYFPAKAGTPALLVDRYFSTSECMAGASPLKIPLERSKPDDWDGFV
jgi:serine/threonine-protein phosphatase CPPED1